MCGAWRVQDGVIVTKPRKDGKVWVKYESDNMEMQHNLFTKDYFKLWCFIKMKPEGQAPFDPLAAMDDDDFSDGNDDGEDDEDGDDCDEDEAM